jgi:hypothetical protein
MKSMPLQHANSMIGKIFSITGTNENGRKIIRCSRCEGFPQKERGKSFQVLTGATTKMKEHIAASCPCISSSTDSFDETLRHTLLVYMPEKQVSSLSKYGQIKRIYVPLFTHAMYYILHASMKVEMYSTIVQNIVMS